MGAKRKRKKHPANSRFNTLPPEILNALRQEQEKAQAGFVDQATAIKTLFLQYSPEDICVSLFVLATYLPNISSQIKHILLTSVLTSLKYENFTRSKSITTYSDFQNFYVALQPQLPSFPFLEDYVPEMDWGEVKFHFAGRNYKVFYGSELSNVYDYLSLFEMLHCTLEEEYVKRIGRSPSADLQQTLKLQDEIISSIHFQPSIVDVENGHFELPSEGFWNCVTTFLAGFNPRESFEEFFVETFSIDLGNLDEVFLHQNQFQEDALTGRVLQAYFIKIGERYFPILPRRYSATLFDHWCNLYQKVLPELRRDKIDHQFLIAAELNNYIRKRFRSKSFLPFVSVVTCQERPHQVVFASSFVSSDKLILIFLSEPHASAREIEKETRKLTQPFKEAVRLASISPLKLAVHGIRQVAQLGPSGQTEILEPCIFYVVPQVSSSLGAFRVSRKFRARVMLLDQFLGIIDELQNEDEFGEFIKYLKELDNVVISPMNSPLDQFGSFKDSYGLLVDGATRPDGVYLYPHWGSNKRFETLSEFWKMYPESDFLGHPRSWTIIEESRNKYRLDARGYFGCALYCKIGLTDVFLSAPFDEMNYEQAKVTNFLLECLQDTLVQNIGLVSTHPYFDSKRKLYVLFFPKSLVTEKPQFAHLRHLTPEGKAWVSNTGLPAPDSPGIRIVFDEDAVLRLFSKPTDRSAEITLLTEVLVQLNTLVACAHLKQIEQSLQELKTLPPRFVMFETRKIASFPELVGVVKPEPQDFKRAKRRLAEIAARENVQPGDYALEEAKNKLNKLRKAMLKEIESEIIKYDYTSSVPLLITRTDALSNEYEEKRTMIRSSLQHEVDYDRDERFSEEGKEYRDFHRNFRYLIEKFVQLRPKGSKSLSTVDLKYLLALVDWLLVIYAASDSLHYELFPTGLVIDSDFKLSVHYGKDLEEKENAFGAEEARIELGMIGDRRDKVESPRPVEEYLDELNHAFESDLGFGLSDVLDVLNVLSFWPSYASDVVESAYYSAPVERAVQVCCDSIRGITETRIPIILDFLTLKSKDVIRILDQDEDCEDVPVWEHRKRFARYTIRPLIQIRELYFWGPLSAHKSSVIWAGSTSSGTLPTDLKGPNIESILEQQRQLVSKALVKKTVEIVKRFTQHADMNVYLHKRDPSGHHPEDLGDYDVLAFESGKNVVLNIECKDISPPFCPKDAKRLRETIFGEEGKDMGHFRQINARRDYLAQHIGRIAALLRWPLDTGRVPTFVTLYVTRRNYWWTQYPPRQVDATFVRVDLLSTFLQRILA